MILHYFSSGIIKIKKPDQLTERLYHYLKRAAKKLDTPLFYESYFTYIGGAGLPAMVINGQCNKPIGPGGGTRRLHHNQNGSRFVAVFVMKGAKQDRQGRKDCSFTRHCTTVIGLLK